MSALTDIKGLGESSEKLLNKLGLKEPLDLIENIPRKYDDYSKITSIKHIKPGLVTIQARLHSINKRYSRKGLHITEALASDETGTVSVRWFNQPYRAQSIKINEQYFLSGEFAQNYKYLSINNPACELVSDFPLHTARLVPQYKLTKGLSSNQLRKFTKQAFEQTVVNETLPDWLIDEKQLIGRKEALFAMHFPDKIEVLQKARKRLGFEELFTMSLASELNRRDFAKEKALHIPFNQKIITDFVSSLPFALTNDQRKSSWQILQDMTKGSPMNRLLEGDVGSGKTVVAAIAMLNTVSAGYQSAFMAPTEILASQHAKTLEKILPKNIAKKVVFLSGSMTVAQKKNANSKIINGDASIIIGTHALFQKSVEFKNLALIVIDEQHRFGVEQRKKLQAKATEMPHVLNMTATPIPRSIALTLYGEMDISLLSEKPANRIEIKTKVLQPEIREQLYKTLEKDLVSGRQAYIVCPEILDSEKPGRPLSVDSIAKQIKTWLKDFSIQILHGKMKSEDKETIMQDFLNGKTKVLVSTTVIEVGVDVPNASIMIVEGADRFGLAQLHQLRGRIGRGEHASNCYLITTENGNITKRLKIIEQETNGFKLAEYDLEIRGPGSIYGTFQHGALDLRVAKITDTKLIAEARESARNYVIRGENMLIYKELAKRVKELRTITNLN